MKLVCSLSLSIFIQIFWSGIEWEYKQQSVFFETICSKKWTNFRIIGFVDDFKPQLTPEYYFLQPNDCPD